MLFPSIQTVKETLQRHWKWLFLFLLLPTLGGCVPSLGFPFSFPLGETSDFHGFTNFFELEDIPVKLAISFLLLNFLTFTLFFPALRNYFINHTIQLKIIFIYFIWEGIITFLYALTAFESIPEYIGISALFTLSYWTSLIAGLSLAALDLFSGTLIYIIFIIIDKILWILIIFWFSKSIEFFLIKRRGKKSA